MFKIIAFFVIKLFARLYVRVDITFACGKQFHDRIISLRGESWDHKINPPSPFLLEQEVPVLSYSHMESIFGVFINGWMFTDGYIAAIRNLGLARFRFVLYTLSDENPRR